MKAILRIPLYFLLYTVIFIALAYGLVLFYRIADFDQSLQLDFISMQVPVLRDVLVLAIPLGVLAVVVSLFSVLKIAALRFMARFLLILLSAAYFFGIFFSWNYLETFEEKKAWQRVGIIPQTIYETRGLQFMVEKIENTAVFGIWTRLDRPAAQLERWEQGYIDREENVMVIEGPGNRIPLTELSNGKPGNDYSGNQQGNDVFLISRITQFLQALLTYAAKDVLGSIIVALSLSLSIVSLWFWVRFSRWPLWNAALVWFWVLAYGFLADLFLQTSTVNLLASLHPIAGQYAIPLVSFLYMVIWSSCLLLLPSFKDWKREVAV